MLVLWLRWTVLIVKIHQKLREEGSLNARAKYSIAPTEKRRHVWGCFTLHHQWPITKLTRNSERRGVELLERSTLARIIKDVKGRSAHLRGAPKRAYTRFNLYCGSLSQIRHPLSWSPVAVDSTDTRIVYDYRSEPRRPTYPWARKSNSKLPPRRISLSNRKELCCGIGYIHTLSDSMRAAIQRLASQPANLANRHWLSVIQRVNFLSLPCRCPRHCLHSIT